jgi:hypothetical protein
MKGISGNWHDLSLELRILQAVPDAIVFIFSYYKVIPGV